ncbi:MFS transporter [Janibacter sp. G349]
MDRRILLACLLAVLMVGNVLTALVDAYPLVLLARLCMGFANGLFWAIGVGTAVRLVPGQLAGRASAIVLSGISIAAVAGVPLGTLMGNVTGWRAAFLAWGGLSLLSLLAVLATLPRLPSQGGFAVAQVLALPVRNTLLRRVVIAMFLLVLGHFAAYTYARPWLEESTMATPTFIVIVLIVFGVGGAVGNIVGGRLAEKRPGWFFAVASGGVLLAVLLLPTVSWSLWLVVLVLTLWGFAFGASNVAEVKVVLTAAPSAFEAAMSINTLAYNTSLALGALAGGMLVDLVGVDGAIVLAAVICALSLAAQACLRTWADRMPADSSESADVLA